MNARKKNAHCSFCGQSFAAGQTWPRQCGSCENISYVNPLPVVVTLVPIDSGLLCVRRSIPPGAGKLALPGGFLEVSETWQEGCVRELREETGLVIDPGEMRLFRADSVPDEGLLLLFGLARARSPAELAFVPNAETSELVVMPGPAELAFPTHTRAAIEYFALAGRS